MDQEVRRIALYFSLCFYFLGGWGRGESYNFPINDLVFCI